jgi:hypothetical protein
MTNLEVFKPIENYEGLYEISNFGRVKTLYKKRYHTILHTKKIMIREYPEKIMSLQIDKGGYLRIHLRKIGNKSKLFGVHRLVAQAFIPNPNNFPFTNHIDNNVKNNNVDNLEWVTAKSNSNHMILCNRQIKGEQVNTSKLKENDVREIINLGNKFTQTQLAKKFGVTQTVIGGILRNESWKSIPRTRVKVKNKYFDYGK